MNDELIYLGAGGGGGSGGRRGGGRGRGLIGRIAQGARNLAGRLRRR